MQKRHTNRQQYFNEQAYTTEQYVIPFIELTFPVNASLSILEIGCGEAGNLKPFLDRGCQRVVGIDLSANKIRYANEFMADHPNRQQLELIHADFYTAGDIGKFDLIITRDVLEHIHGHERFLRSVQQLLTPRGRFFLGFPPWQNPFGGHQQICKSKWLSRIPFLHLLPKSLYKSLLKTFGESDLKIADLMEIRQTRITIERFENLLVGSGYKKDQRTFYFINPNYEVKFGLKPRKQLPVLSSIPYFRNFLITTNYYLLSLDEETRALKNSKPITTPVMQPLH